jgi:hypothetical protein
MDPAADGAGRGGPRTSPGAPPQPRSPSQARVYDYFLGGKDNYAVDRDVAARLTAVAADLPALARANRGFLARAVEAMARAGISQFLDLGTGIPTSPNVHEIVARVHPDARVAYVDNDPVVIAHARAVLAARPHVVVVEGDVTRPETILGHPGIAGTLDLDRPVGVLLLAVLNFVEEGVALKAVAEYRDRVVAGSQLAVSVGTDEGADPAVSARLSALYPAAGAATVVGRSRAQVEELLGDFEPVEPGLVDVTQWRSGGSPGRLRALCAVARKR